MSVGSAISLATDRLTAPVEGMHRAISARWFAALGPVGAPVRVVHDAVSTIVYQSIRFGASAVGAFVDARAGLATQTAHSAQAIVNGIWGDTLGRHEERLGISLSIRDPHGHAVASDGGLAAAFPAATGRLVVLVHGLFETEQCWEDPAAGGGLGRAIDEHDELTKVAVRYNSGLPVSESGYQLAGLLESLTHGWPVPLESIALVGHSMGGLVVRAAVAAADRDGLGWLQRLDDLITVAAPHQGAPMEKLVNATSWALGIAPETRPLADFLEGRSGGIKDLRYGVEAELTPGVRHHFLAGVVTSDPEHLIGAALGDLVVTTASASDAGGEKPTTVVALGGSNHFAFLDDPRVIGQVMKWLESRAT